MGQVLAVGVFLLLWYGVHEHALTRGNAKAGHCTEEDINNAETCHPVTALNQIQGGTTHVLSRHLVLGSALDANIGILIILIFSNRRPCR